MKYPVLIEKIDDEYVATISHPDGVFQGVCSGKTKAEATSQLASLLEAMIASAMKDGEVIPMPKSCERGNSFVMIRPMTAAKALVYNEMRLAGIRKADMAKAMGVNQKQIDRILDPAHRSTLGQLEAAALSIGKHIELRLA